MQEGNYANEFDGCTVICPSAITCVDPSFSQKISKRLKFSMSSAAEMWCVWIQLMPYKLLFAKLRSPNCGSEGKSQPIELKPLDILKSSAIYLQNPVLLVRCYQNLVCRLVSPRKVNDMNFNWMRCSDSMTRKLLKLLMSGLVNELQNLFHFAPGGAGSFVNVLLVDAASSSNLLKCAFNLLSCDCNHCMWCYRNEYWRQLLLFTKKFSNASQWNDEWSKRLSVLRVVSSSLLLIFGTAEK
jgi:hypothetical protein